MAIIVWHGKRAEFLLLSLFTSCALSFLPSVKCQYCNMNKDALQIEIYSNRSSNALPSGISISMTCRASRTDGKMDSNPRIIEWFDPQQNKVRRCTSGLPVAKAMTCTLVIGVLTKDNVGNYTCKASDHNSHCRTNRIQVDFQELHVLSTPIAGSTQENVLGTLQATTESTKQKQEPIKENENSGSSKTQAYILYGIAIILILVCCFLLSYWLYRRIYGNHKRVKSESSFPVREIIPLDKWEILPKQIKYEEELGQGAFGVVYKATLKRRAGIEVFDSRKGLEPKRACQVVAVKVLQDHPSDEQKEVFLHEITQMKLLGSHQNIVSLVGCCTLHDYKFLVIEYVPFGDLLQWLRHRRRSINGHGSAKEKGKEECYDGKETLDDQRKAHKAVEVEIVGEQAPLITKLSPSKENGDVIIDMSLSSENLPKENGENSIDQENIPLVSMPSTSQRNSNAATILHLEDNDEEADSFTTQQLFSFAWQIARGMNHLAEKNFIHRDLAARNILVGSDNRVKVSDFGLIRQIYEDVNVRGKCTKLPVKWMAPEAIFQQLFTIKSDTWSYGILLWEMATMGGVPYPTLTNSELYKLLKTGYRMERPDMCCDEVYELMCDCWRENPSSRPSFSELIGRLEVIMMRDVLYCDLSKHDESRPYYNVPAKYTETSG